MSIKIKDEISVYKSEFFSLFIKLISENNICSHLTLKVVWNIRMFSDHTVVCVIFHKCGFYLVTKSVIMLHSVGIVMLNNINTDLFLKHKYGSFRSLAE